MNQEGHIPRKNSPLFFKKEMKNLNINTDGLICNPKQKKRINTLKIKQISRKHMLGAKTSVDLKEALETIMAPGRNKPRVTLNPELF